MRIEKVSFDEFFNCIGPDIPFAGFRFKDVAAFVVAEDNTYVFFVYVVVFIGLPPGRLTAA